MVVYRHCKFVRLIALEAGELKGAGLMVRTSLLCYNTADSMVWVRESHRCPGSFKPSTFMPSTRGSPEDLATFHYVLLLNSVTLGIVSMT